MAKVIPLAGKVNRHGRGSLRGRLVMAEDWDSDEVNEAIASDFGIRASGFRELPISFDHAVTAGRLPLIHREPFDRMLVAQAQCEQLTLVTRDRRCQQYDVAVLKA